MRACVRKRRLPLPLQAFSSADSAALIEQALKAVGGVRTGGPPKHDAATGAKHKEGEVQPRTRMPQRGQLSSSWLE